MTPSIYLSHLFHCVNMVSDTYYNATTFVPLEQAKYPIENTIRENIKTYDSEFAKSIMEQIYEGNTQSRERNFCYELYSIWRRLFEKKSTKSRYNNLILNGEISKRNFLEVIKEEKEYFNQLFSSNNFISICDEFNKLKENKDDSKDFELINQKSFEPDLTLHHNYGSFKRQELIVEVKTHLSENDNEILKDYYKLLIYKHLLFFKEVVFVGVRFEKDKLSKIFEKISPDIRENNLVYLIIRNEDSTIITNVNRLVSGEEDIFKADVNRTNTFNF